MAILERKMAILQGEISEQAALAAQRHKFNQGSLQPTGDTSPGRLASGLAATAHVRPSCEILSKLMSGTVNPVMPGCHASRYVLYLEYRNPAVTISQDHWHVVQIMAQAERLSQLAAEHQQLITTRAPACDMSGTMLGMQDRHAALADAIVDAEARISDVVRQREESQAIKGEQTY